MNPYIEYRKHLDVYHYAQQQGVSDSDYVKLVEELDSQVAALWGSGFSQTPLIDLQLDSVEQSGPVVGSVLAKVETGNVSGSHKARHLFGLVIRHAIDHTDRANQPLAIASCGNAALAAAVVAGATGYDLQVFVPESADPAVLEQLDRFGAHINVCSRAPGVDGDPCLATMLERVDAGAEAFTVQGPICPDSIDGARTLGLELAAQLDEREVWPDHIWIQIGGGALATAVLDGLARAINDPGRTGGTGEAPGRADRRLPRLHPVQARSAHPYIAGWQRISAVLYERFEVSAEAPPADQAQQLAEAVAAAAAEGGQPVAAYLSVLLEEQAALMTTWPGEPHSVASGILDDLTYDWRTVMAHQIATGGWPVSVDESTFVNAAKAVEAQATPPPDETGAAGLAGLLHAAQAASFDRSALHVVLLTGMRRSSTP